MRSSNELTGDLASPAAAFDGDDTTVWTTSRSRPTRSWFEVTLPSEQTVTNVPLTIVNDGRHTVPTKVEVWVDGDIRTELDLPEIEDQDTPNGTTTVDLELPEALRGTQFRFRFTGTRLVKTHDWVSDSRVAQPLAVAEVGLPGPKVPALASEFDSGCRDDLLFVDDQPVPVRIRGTMADAMAAKPLDIEACGGTPLHLDGGDHELHSAPGLVQALDIDGLVLRSAPGGEASDATGTLVEEGAEVPVAADEPDAAAVDAPAIKVTDEGPDKVHVSVSGAAKGEPFWLVLGQSYNEGWQAVADGETLEPPQLVNGYANGWRVVAPGESFDMTLTFTPQKRVNIALLISAITAVIALVLVWRKPKFTGHWPTAMPEPYSPVLAYRYEGALPTRGKAVGVGVGMAIVAWILVGPAGRHPAGRGVGRRVPPRDVPPLAAAGPARCAWRWPRPT